MRGSRLTIRLVVFQWAVTFVHHLYGGLAFDSPGRVVTAFVFGAVLAGTLWLHRLGAVRRWASWACRGVIAVFWVGLLGLYEGGYNHTLYSVLRWLDPDRAARLYPAGSDATISSDIFFQGTGVLTLLAGLGVAVAVLTGRRGSDDAGERRAAWRLTAGR